MKILTPSFTSQFTLISKSLKKNIDIILDEKKRKLQKMKQHMLKTDPGIKRTLGTSTLYNTSLELWEHNTKSQPNFDLREGKGMFSHTMLDQVQNYVQQKYKKYIRNSNGLSKKIGNKIRKYYHCFILSHIL